MVRTRNLALVLTYGVIFSQAPAHAAPDVVALREYARRMQAAEQNIALFTATKDNGKLTGLADDGIEIVKGLEKHRESSVGYSCFYSAVRLTDVALKTASGRSAEQDRRHYVTLINLCERGLDMAPPAEPNLR